MAAVGRYPVVVKADGLAAGKGVVIAADEAQAREALTDMLERQVFGRTDVIAEDFLEGEELSLLALWFLCCERRRVGGENPGGDGVAGARGVRPAAARPGAGPRADRRGGVARPVAEGGGADLSLAQGHRRLAAAPAATGYQLIM